jgi:hypothetical protein
MSPLSALLTTAVPTTEVFVADPAIGDGGLAALPSVA